MLDQMLRFLIKTGGTVTIGDRVYHENKHILSIKKNQSDNQHAETYDRENVDTGCLI